MTTKSKLCDAHDTLLEHISQSHDHIDGRFDRLDKRVARLTWFVLLASGIGSLIGSTASEEQLAEMIEQTAAQEEHEEGDGMFLTHVIETKVDDLGAEWLAKDDPSIVQWGRLTIGKEVHQIGREVPAIDAKKGVWVLHYRSSMVIDYLLEEKLIKRVMSEKAALKRAEQNDFDWPAGRVAGAIAGGHKPEAVEDVDAGDDAIVELSKDQDEKTVKVKAKDIGVTLSTIADVTGLEAKQ